MSEHDDNHGHSVAAWTAVLILIVASAVMSLAVLFPNVWLFVAGVVLAVVGVVAGKVLSMAGYGSAERDRDEAPSIR
ncbi:MAG TPA: HGxxPAAW family protein [Ornithinibacter sp.]|nr:HGxxPAAW family protein [Ornithinibacter sp.]